MKILIITNYNAVYGGNFIPSLEAFAEHCVKRGGVIGFAFKQGAGERQWCKNLQKDYPVYFMSGGVTMKTILTLNRYIKENGYDCVYTHFASWIPHALYLINPKLSVICHRHTEVGNERCLKRKIEFAITNLLFSRQISQIYVSERLKKLEGGENNENCYYVPNALCISRFNKGERSQDRKELRNLLNISSSDPVIMMFGWDKRRKGVDIALKSFEILLKSQPNSHLLIVGGGENYSLSEYSIDPNASRKVHLLPPSQNVGKYHAATDIFLSSSRAEGFPYSILEALYWEEWVISSNIESAVWAGKYKTVEFFESENSEECACKMDMCIRTLNDRRQELAETAREVEMDYQIGNWAEKVYEIVRKQWGKKNKQR